MTDLLEKAIAQIKTLPEAEQNELAQVLLDEIRWEYRQPLGDDAGKLKDLAAEALAEYRAGKTRPMGK